MQRVEVGDAVHADDTASARRRMGAHARVAPRAELLAARIRIDLELAAQASFRAVFMSDMGRCCRKRSLRSRANSDSCLRGGRRVGDDGTAGPRSAAALLRV